jgi:hypothetical protein
MAANQATGLAGSALRRARTTRNTPQSWRLGQNALTHLEQSESAVAATPLEITLIVRLVNNIVPR